MASNISACLPIALRLVRESMVHDSEDRKKEAFCQYLSNIVYICGVLKDEAWQKDLKGCYSQETLKLFKLSSQCLERAEDLLKTATDDLVSTPPTKETQPSTPARKISQDTVDHPSFHYPLESQPSSLKPVNKQLHLPSPPVSPNFQRRIQYIDEAKRGNTQLLAAYRARMEKRENQMANSRLTRKPDVTTMNLSLFRKMAENIEIAKARQKSLEKKMSERQQRLQEEADRRMGPSSLLTTTDRLKKEIYLKVLEFEQETVWLVTLRNQLKAKPEDSLLIQRIITQVLGTSEHPLTKFLQSHQFEIHKELTVLTEKSRDILTHIANLESINSSNYEVSVKDDKTFEKETETNQELDEAKEISFDGELSELLDAEKETGEEHGSDLEPIHGPADSKESNIEIDFGLLPEDKEKEYRGVLETVVKKVQFSLEILHSLFLLVYEPFSSPAGQDLCLASVEYAFFRPLWPLLLNLYRVVNYRKEAKLATVFLKNNSCTPKSLSVPERLCLDDQSSDGENSTYPYQPVVDELKSLKTFGCPLEKLECIVRANRVIVECVEEYYETKGSSRNSPEAVIGCDDLLPILSYVIIRCGLPQLVSECHAMEDFISTDYLMGEEGYSLTTFQTALAYLETLEDS